MNYNERGADPQGGVARYPRVGTESGDPRRIREAIGVLRSIPDAQGPGQQDRKRGQDPQDTQESEDPGKTIRKDPDWESMRRSGEKQSLRNPGHPEQSGHESGYLLKDPI